MDILTDIAIFCVGVYLGYKIGNYMINWNTYNEQKKELEAKENARKPGKFRKRLEEAMKQAQNKN